MALETNNLFDFFMLMFMRWSVWIRRLSSVNAAESGDKRRLQNGKLQACHILICRSRNIQIEE